MKRLPLLLSVVAVAVCAANAEAREGNRIRIECQIFKLTGNFRAETRRDEQIWTTDEPPEKLKNVVTVFNRGWFELGEDRLEFKDGRWLWKERPLPIGAKERVSLPEDKITIVYQPLVVEMEEHSSRTVTIGSQQPIQYFEKREDGLFELKEIELPTGLDMKIEAVEEEDRGYIRLTDIVMTMRLVESRETIEGVNLPVGRPILGEKKYTFYFRLRPGKDYGVLIRPQFGQAGLLLRLRASSVASGTIPKNEQE